MSTDDASATASHDQDPAESAATDQASDADASEVPKPRRAVTKETPVRGGSHNAERPAARPTRTSSKTSTASSARSGASAVRTSRGQRSAPSTSSTDAAATRDEETAEEPGATPAPTEALPSETAPEDAARAAASTAGAGRRVVVAEDEALIRLDVVETLTEAGYDVVGEAGDGERAVALATELRPDVVVMDIKMPVMDGLTAAERIGRARIAPVVLLTAFSQAELVERARDAGAMAYVVKPFTPGDLLPAIEIAVARHQQIAALEAEVADLTERFETRKRVDRAKGLLMTKMGLTEPESFRWIQKTSMDRRLTMREVADAVIEQVGAGDKTR